MAIHLQVRGAATLRLRCSFCHPLRAVYFGTLTVVNICLGLAATVLTWLVGLPHPFLWGMLAAVLNFIPYVGAAIALFRKGFCLCSSTSQRQCRHHKDLPCQGQSLGQT
jgi:hypothetical protein